MFGVADLPKFVERAQIHGEMSPHPDQREAAFRLLQADEVGDDKLRVQVEVTLAAIFLVGLDTDRALQCLSRFLDVTPGKEVRIKSALDVMSRAGDPIAAATVLTQGANLQYRLNAHFDNGVLLAKRAEELFSTITARGDQERLWLGLARNKNRIWWARLCWRAGVGDPDGLLEKAIRELQETYAPESPDDKVRPGGVSLFIAIAFEMSAAFDWSRGRAESAQRKAYQALYFLRDDDGTPRDEIRTGFALYTASRVSASSSVEQFSFALQFARTAKRIFRAKGHVFETRAQIQEARVLVKMARFVRRRSPKDSQRVDQLLERANALLTTDYPMVPDGPEKTYAQAECNLTLIWIATIRAAEDENQWQTARALADQILKNAGSLPRRLQAEAKLHRGRAWVQMGRVGDGRREIQEAREMAHDLSRVKVEIACALAEAESHVGTDIQEARLNWEYARRMGATVQSNFLREWIDELAPMLGGPVMIDLSGSFRKAERRFYRQYINYHSTDDKDVQAVLKSTGLTQSKYYRLLDKAGLPHRSRAGRPRTHGATTDHEDE